MSANDLRRDGGPLAVLENAPTEHVRGLDAVVLPASRIPLLERLTGRRALDATVRLERLRLRMARQAAIRSLVEREPRDAALPPPAADPTLPLVELPARPGIRNAVAGVLAEGVAHRAPWASVLYIKGVRRRRCEGRTRSPWRSSSTSRERATCRARESARPDTREPSGWQRRARRKRLVESLCASPGGWDGLAALELLCAAARARAASTREALLRSRARLRTIQGDVAELSVLAEGSVVRFGRDAHAPWPRDDAPTRFDRPLLWVPRDARGELLLEVLAAVKLSPIDVTEAVAEVVRTRRTAAEDEGPIFAAPPAHPLLRLRADKLGVPGLGGELEIVPMGAAAVTLRRASRTRELGPGELAVLRVPVQGRLVIDQRAPLEKTLETLSVRLARAVRDLAAHLDELPGFVRAELARHVVAAAEKRHDMSEKLRAAPVFPAPGGGFVSYDAWLRRRGDRRPARHPPRAPRRARRAEDGKPRRGGAPRRHRRRGVSGQVRPARWRSTSGRTAPPARS